MLQAKIRTAGDDRGCGPEPDAKPDGVEDQDQDHADQQEGNGGAAELEGIAHASESTSGGRQRKAVIETRMPDPLWAPWRLEYIKQAGEQEGCVFCDEAAGALEPAESLLVDEGASAIALLNKYPYSSGHLMVAPRRHVGQLGELMDDEVVEINRLAVARAR